MECIYECCKFTKWCSGFTQGEMKKMKKNVFVSSVFEDVCGFMKKGFTLIELLVVIAIISILAAILFPVFAQAREKARQSTCLSNFKNVGLAMTMYTDDYDETYVSMGNWKTKIEPYIKTKNIYYCPSRAGIKQAGNWFLGQAVNIGSVNGAVDGVTGLINYAGADANGTPGIAVGSVTSPADKIMVVEWGRANDGFGGCNAGAPVGAVLLGNMANSNWACYSGHNGLASVTFCDGHVKSLKPSVFHSNITGVNSDGTFVTLNNGAVTPVAEATWRKYWDMTY